MHDDAPDYGNWVSQKLIAWNAAIAVLFVALSWLASAFLVAAGLFMPVCAYFAYARFKFSRRGGDLQARIRRLVVDHIDWDGQGSALDIGCGNGPLVIALAEQFPPAHVTGIDLWGGAWEYSKARCERNARVGGVSERVSFQQGSAAKLPFEDGAFDLVVSNLTFHEVRDAADKTLVIKEALRVLRRGGGFVFQDLFGLKRMYGSTDDLIRMIRGWGMARAEFADTSRSPFIPRALRLPFMVGTLGLIHGER